MRSCLISSVERFPWLRIALIGGLILVQSSWTCVAIVGFQSCLSLPPAPQITSLSPNGISATTVSVLLMVSGDDFEPQSQILWNGNPLSTTFIDSQHLQATITQQTFAKFGGAIGNNVLISVNTPVTNTVLGCPISGSSATLILIID